MPIAIPGAPGCRRRRRQGAPRSCRCRCRPARLGDRAQLASLTRAALSGPGPRLRSV